MFESKINGRLSAIFLRRAKILTACLPLFVIGCGDEPASNSDAPPVKPQAAGFDRDSEWLELKDDASPSDWLIARARAAGRNVSDAEIKELKEALRIAVLRLGESARMIVNRSAQLETMLKSEGHEESAVGLIPLLTGAVGETGQTEGFGAVSQHYFNMRKAGMTSAAARDDLRKRYGPRS